MLPCYFKALSGLDCPGCGFQRSVLELTKGNFVRSFELYPAASPILILTLLGLLQMIISAKWLKVTTSAMLYVCILLVSASYIVKLIR